MIIKVLGSSAGGGLPQWNCNCNNCAAARLGRHGLQSRTQSSLAVSRDGESWILLNASPDLRTQIAATAELSPRAAEGLRNSPIKAVAMTNADVDHIAGLLTLREGQAFTIYAAQRVLDIIARNPIFEVLRPNLVSRQALSIDNSVEISGAGVNLGLSIEAFYVPGKIALYLEDSSASGNFGTQEGDTLGFRVFDSTTGRAFFYIPGVSQITDELADRLRGAELLFCDGTLWHDGEMIEKGLLDKSGKRMGHISMTGPEGSISSLASLGIKHRIFVHINNSNPVLDEASKERQRAEAAGWEIGYDGMEVRI